MGITLLVYEVFLCFRDKVLILLELEKSHEILWKSRHFSRRDVTLDRLHVDIIDHNPNQVRYMTTNE